MTLKSLEIAALFMSMGIVSANKMQLYRTELKERIKRNLHSNTRLRRLGDGTFEAVPLHAGLGTHYTWVYAGNPPQRASVIVDTGSHLMAFPCSGCDGCGKHTDAPFDMSKSSTLRYPSCTSRPAFACIACGKDDQCHISQSYTEGSSWSAVVVEDTIWLGDDLVHAEKRLNETYSTRFMFGCQTKETGLFISQVADGIMGVANTDSNFIRKLYNEKKIESSAFALCFASNGGTMAIGTLSTTHHEGTIQYAAVTSQRSGWYGVAVRSLRLGGQALDIDISHMNSGHNVIVDSGTTDSYFPKAYADTWNSLFLSVTGKQYQVDGNSCHGYTDEEVDRIPPFQISMQGVNGDDVIMTIPSSQLFPVNSDGKRCGTMYFTEANGGVIGANFMMNHEVVFDPDHKQVGFSRANCDYRGLDAEMPSQTKQQKITVEDDKVDTPVMPGVSTTSQPTTTKPITSLPVSKVLKTTAIPSTTPLQTTIIPTTTLINTSASELAPVGTLFNSTETKLSATAPDASVSAFSMTYVLVYMFLGIVVVMSIYHMKYKRRNAHPRKTEWAQVSTNPSDEEERVPLGEEPLSLRGDEEDSDDDEFFDSEGYVMSPRSMKKCREAFD